jgi:uncharacterized OsmC-like protein
MDRTTLRARQQPLKARYRTTPEAAQVILRAESTVRPELVGCEVATWAGPVTAGLHPATGGEGDLACSGEMLLQALVACTGVTLSAVALAIGITIRAGRVFAQGTWDARGTLGLAADAPVGLARIQLAIELDTDATDEQLARLLELTERYCVVLQTLAHPPATTARVTRLRSAAHDPEQAP